MTTRKQLIEDAREAAADGDWKVAAELFREAGDEISARSCETRIELDAAAAREVAAAIERRRAETKALLQSVAHFLNGGTL